MLYSFPLFSPNHFIDLLQITGEWFSILLASDNREKIEENGSMRFLWSTSVSWKIVLCLLKCIQSKCVFFCLGKEKQKSEYGVGALHTGARMCIYSGPLLKSGPILDKIVGTDPGIEEPEPVTLLDFRDKNWDRNTFQWE